MLYRTECKIVTNSLDSEAFPLHHTLKLDWLVFASAPHTSFHLGFQSTNSVRSLAWLPLPALAGSCPPWGNSNRNSSPPTRKAAWSPGTGLALLPGLVTHFSTWLGSPVWTSGHHLQAHDYSSAAPLAYLTCVLRCHLLPEASSCPGPHSRTPSFCLGLCPLGTSEFWPWPTSLCTEPCAAPPGPCGPLLDMYGWTIIIRRTVSLRRQ